MPINDRQRTITRNDLVETGPLPVRAWAMMVADSAARLNISPSWETAAISDIDMGSSSTANSHGAKGPARAMAAPPTATQTMPDSSRDR